MRPRFSRRSLMLAEADTIQKAKELKSLALTAAEWAKRKNMGEEAIQHCRSYALEAERKMGQMLIEGKAAGEVAKQGRPKNLTAGKVIPTKCDDVGISWRESAEAQMLAELPHSSRYDAVEAILLPDAYRQTIFDSRCDCGHVRAKEGRSDGTPHPPMLRKLLPPAQTGIREGPFIARDWPGRNRFRMRLC